MNRSLIAWRSLKREWRAGDLRIVAMALVVATAAAVSVASFGDRLGQAMARQGGELLGADLVVHMQGAVSPERRAWAENSGLAQSQTVHFRSVVFAGELSKLAEVKAVESGYPLRGTLRIADGVDVPDAPAQGVPDSGEVWVDAQLLAELQLEPGDQIGLGASQFKISRVVTLEPDRGGVAFTLAPRVMLNMDDLAATELVQPGSLVHYHWLLAGTPQQIRDARLQLISRGVLEADLRDADSAQPRFRIALERGERFLLLATLVSVLLAGIAIARSTRHYAQRQWDNAAIMRCFGAKQRDITIIYVTQLVMLAGLASLVGVVLGFLGQQVLVAILSGLISGELPLPSWRPVVLGLALGLTTVLGFGLPPLLRLKDVPPLRVIRRDLDVIPVRAWLIYGAALVAFAALVFWVAGELALALWVIGGTVLTVLVLTAVSVLTLKILGRFRTRVGTAWRFGIASLVRRAGSSTSQIVALGVGVMAILLLTIVRSDLWDQWQVSLPADTPNHFLINIQPDQTDELAGFFEKQGLPEPSLTPIVRARLLRINNQPVDPDDFASGFAKSQINRAANLSWADVPQGDNEVVSGRWWTADEFAAPFLSVEQEYADALGLVLGDELTYRIAEQELNVKIVSIRKVGWDSFRPNFFLIVPPDLLKDFPVSYITSIYLPRSQNAKLRQVFRKFPNITDIDVDALLEQVRRVLDKINTALQFIFVFTLAAGVVVLWAALNTSRLERRKEIAVLRALGARTNDLRRGVVAEFLVLGLLAGLVGTLAAALVGYGLSRFLFDLPYQGNVLMWLTGVLTAVALVVGASLSAVRTDLDSPPWQALRETE